MFVKYNLPVPYFP